MNKEDNYKSNEELLKEYQRTKDINIRNKIALNNIRLVYSIVNKYSHDNVNSKDELVQEGFYYLLKAIDNFDCNKGNKFSTYAYWYIINVLNKTLRYNENISLDEPVKNTDDSEEINLIDTIEDETINIFKEVDSRNIEKEIRDCLSDTEYKVLKYHFDYNITLKDISNKLGIDYKETIKIKNIARNKVIDNKYFREYKQEMENKREITYLKAYDYSKIRVQSSNISNPVWDIVLQREKRDDEVFKSIFK